MISKRTLEKWRREAMVISIPLDESSINILSKENEELRTRILKMTQELLDQYLIYK